MATPEWGYVSDVPYVRHFVPWMAPAHLDLVALLHGVAPPDRRSGFTWCELGCGYADTGTVLAATHPTGCFHGIDLIPENIRDARALADSAGIRNLSLHALDFADAIDLELPTFDYIAAHGVYSWIEDPSRANFRAFIDRHLGPGGLVALSYNAMPGWAADQVFQYLVRAAGAGAAGDSMTRYRAAETLVRGLVRAGAPALLQSPLATAELPELHEVMPESYFPLEYLQPGWRAFYVTEMRSQMAEIGLEPVGSASLVENFDRFMLKEVWRDALAEVADPNLRELVRDYFLQPQVRRDVFTRGARQVGDADRLQRLSRCVFGLSRPASLIKYEMETRAGRVRFDNPVAHGVVALLANGPKPLAEIAAHCSEPVQDVLPSALTLAASGATRVLGPDVSSSASLNRALSGLGEGFAVKPYVATRFGTAIAVEPEVWRRVTHGAPLPERVFDWADFLARYV